MASLTLKKKAIRIFQNWAGCALKLDKSLNLQIKEFDIFETQLTNAIKKAKKSLLKESKSKRIKWQDYDYGFMCGFIMSNLSTLWNHEYITRQSNEFKIFISIKSLENYLVYDEILAVKLNSFYQQFYASMVNIENVDPKIIIDPKNEFSHLKEDISLHQNDFKTAIDNIILYYATKFSNENNEIFPLKIEKYFTTVEIKAILKSTDY